MQRRLRRGYGRVQQPVRFKVRGACSASEPWLVRRRDESGRRGLGGSEIGKKKSEIGKKILVLNE